jgi:hypothetical protein
MTCLLIFVILSAAKNLHLASPYWQILQLPLRMTKDEKNTDEHQIATLRSQ